MNEPGTDWVSPHWENLPYPDPLAKPSHWAIAYLWILNPGAVSSRLRIRFFDFFGGLVWEDAPTVGPRELLTMGAPDHGAHAGWCHISSEQPVVPSGLTAFMTSKDTGYVNMTFFTADPALRDFAPKQSTLGREEPLG